jgi:signal transduction histidine kinase
VVDTGYGVPKNQHSKIFAKLFRASNIKSKDTDGTGLGLFIVKAILEQVGGRIQFTSVENEGSTFIALLPVENEQHKGEKNA